MSGHLLVTGFGPFPGMPDNPSARLARCLGTSVRLRLGLGRPPRVLVLPTAYAAIPADLMPALAEGPGAVLMFGVASRARRMRVEGLARNRGSLLYPDASGRPAARLALDPGGPPARRSTMARQALAILRRHGLSVLPSNDAGRYLCNASYFAALAAPCPVLFVHILPVPRTRRPRKAGGTGPDRQVAALADVAVALMIRGARLRRL
ncbi:pyroglutamyl-peptidase I family protein [Methylobacterium trifolii]|uniref:Pyrrolidone-carboxylate peptidase n=1 Tax=Methylobacterium trifolii TaxID=1003092 RepID=A0ABQ4TTF0_9HYPH|nr:peptidase C15 [Methylobacterium trifolii]GJE58480.1 Pyrrolidone-carboxylate peptidase [Methylobacterium trifolii]